jgi:hypothetical protein
MENMVRKQIHLRKRQIQGIQRKAESLGISESEVIRRAVDRALQGQSASFYPNPDAWTSLKEFILTYKPAKHADQPYKFNREELYEDRLGRFHADHD